MSALNQKTFKYDGRLLYLKRFVMIPTGQNRQLPHRLPRAPEAAGAQQIFKGHLLGVECFVSVTHCLLYWLDGLLAASSNVRACPL